MKIIKEREFVERYTYDLTYEWRNEPGTGFGFPCDQDGKIDLENMPFEAKGNYEKCQSGEYDVICKGVVKLNTSYWEDRVGLCDCGREVVLSGFTNTCEGCGRDYNWNGTLLAPREYWGEETGEHPADILMIR